MVKKIYIFLFLVLTALIVLPTSESYAINASVVASNVKNAASGAYSTAKNTASAIASDSAHFVKGAASDISNIATGTYYGIKNGVLSLIEKHRKCEILKKAAKTKPPESSYKNDIIPVSLLQNFANTVHNISNNLVSISVLGDALMCHAVHGDPWKAMVGNIQLFDWANIPIWLCGAIIYCFGFMLVLSVTFYIVDVSFKLGFAIIVLPIAIALWPFAWTKDKLMVCISVFLKSAGILIFLSLTTAYALNMLSVVLSGLTPIMEALTENKTKEVAETFSLTSGTFLLVVVVLIYGMKMIGATIPDYVDKFFPDNMFGKGSKASPMHMLSTQGLDFVKQKAVAPAAKFAHDVVRTQSGRLVSGTGKLIQGKYHNQIKSGLHQAGVAIRNPNESLQKLGYKLADKAVAAGASVAKKYNDLKFDAKSALGSAMLSGEGRQAFQAHVAEQKKAANTGIDNKFNEIRGDIQNEKDNLNAQIHQNEAQRNANPSAFRQAINNSGVLDIPQKAAEWHAQNQQEANKKLETLHQELHEKLVTKGSQNSVNQKIEKMADAIKNNKAAQWYRRNVTDNIDKATKAIDNFQQRVATGMYNGGILAEKSSDGWGKWAAKRVGRRIINTAVGLTVAPAKLATRAVSLAAKAPDLVVRGTTQILNQTAQNLVNTGASVANGVIRTAHVATNSLRYTGAISQKYGDKFLKGVGNVWKVPGKILEGTGDAMQNNRPKANEEYLKQKEWADWEEKKEKEENQE